MVELVVRMEDVSIFFASRSLAVFDRAELRRWFADSRNPIHVDDITLEARGRKLMMALDMASPIPVPSPIAAQLREVV